MKYVQKYKVLNLKEEILLLRCTISHSLFPILTPPFHLKEKAKNVCSEHDL